VASADTPPAPDPAPDPRHVRRDYATDRIVVHWDSARCVHSANCLQGLPEVFDLRGRPWVRIHRADADSVARVVDTCPSRALTYQRLDGAPLGPNGVATPAVPPTGDHPGPAPGAGEAPGDTGITSSQDPAGDAGAGGSDTGGTPVVISLKPDGPLVVEGRVRIELARGEAIEVTDRAALCRCGGSANKPFCDGTHKRIGFHAPDW
jgi:uncharacterized Fe-S cluster protein YjdI